MYNLGSQKRLLTARADVGPHVGYLSQYADFLREATELCDYFGLDLYIKRPATKEDAVDLRFYAS